MSDKMELMPCPFCGKNDAFVEQLDSDASVVICQGRIDEYSACLARGPVGVQESDFEDQPGKDAAIREWNHRAALAQQPAAAVPEGWKLAPVDATLEMVEAFKARATATSRGTILNVGNALNDAIAAAPAAPVAVGQDPDGHSEAWPKAGDRCLCPACCRHRRNASAPPAAEQPTGTTSDQYRAELYDEVWGKARSMGYGNVTDALAELERLKAAEQPDTVAVPRELLADMCSLDHDTRIQAERRLLALLGKEGE